MPKIIVLKTRTMGSRNMDNGPILHKMKIPKYLQNTVENPLGFLAATLRLRVRESLASSNPHLQK
jgi:hypothetical protein